MHVQTNIYFGCHSPFLVAVARCRARLRFESRCCIFLQQQQRQILLFRIVFHENTISKMAWCEVERKKYRACLEDSGRLRSCIRGDSGGSTRACSNSAHGLEVCRKKWRQQANQGTTDDDQVLLLFDASRVLPSKRCQLLNQQVRRCMKWKQNDQSKCEDPIHALMVCMKQA